MRILLIEDDKDISDFLKPALGEACFAVDVAEDGKRGLFLALTNDYDLVILDNMLPEKTGKEVCHEIREKKNVPIIMLSVRSEVKDKVELLKIGADDYLAKPFSFEELLARIKAVMRRPNEMQGDIIKHDKIVLDVVRGEVTCAGKKIELRKKEMMLLEFFLRNPGKIITRAMILEHVWDESGDAFSNTIEAHISSLRKKFGGKKNFPIKTVSGRGYKLEGAS